MPAAADDADSGIGAGDREIWYDAAMSQGSDDVTILMNAAADGEKAAAMVIRQLLVDYGWAGGAHIWGGPAARRAVVKLASLPDPASDKEFSGFMILDEAIARLESVDTEAVAVLRLRYFAGLIIERTAAVLGVSAPTVKRSRAFARGWLKEAIESGRV